MSPADATFRGGGAGAGPLLGVPDLEVVGLDGMMLLFAAIDLLGGGREGGVDGLPLRDTG